MLNAISVKHKIALIISIALIGAACVLAYELIHSRQLLIDSRKQELAYLIESTDSLINHYHSQAAKIGEEKAKEAALAAIQELRYEGGEGYFWINDLSAVIVIHPIKPELNGKDLSNFEDPKGTKVFSEFANTVKNQDSGYVEYYWERPGETKASRKLSYVKLFKPWGWVVGTGIYVDDIEELFVENVISSAVLFAFIIAVVTFIATAITRNIVLPLNQIVFALEKAAKGDLSTQLNAGDRTDEIGLLSNSANGMLLGFRKLIESITSSSDQLLRAAEQLSASSEQTSKGVEQQLGQTELVATAIEEVTATVQEVARNTQEAANATDEVDKETKAGNLMMERTINTISSMSEGTKATSAAIKKLEEDTKQIDSVLDVIRGISEQTNLLALNAAIEAARAGESGRGFAVVADEVRTLAQRTHQSTEEIKTMTELLQNGAQNAVEAMEQGQAQAESALTLAKETGKGMAQIGEQVGVLNNMNTTIATSSEEQGVVVHEVAQNIVNIRDVAEETTSAILSYTQNSQELKEIAQKIDAQISQFIL